MRRRWLRLEDGDCAGEVAVRHVQLQMEGEGERGRDEGKGGRWGWRGGRKIAYLEEVERTFHARKPSRASFLKRKKAMREH